MFSVNRMNLKFNEDDKLWMKILEMDFKNQQTQLLDKLPMMLNDLYQVSPNYLLCDNVIDGHLLALTSIYFKEPVLDNIQLMTFEYHHRPQE